MADENFVVQQEENEAMGAHDSKLYKLITTFAVLGAFLTVGVLILGIILGFLVAPLTLTLAIIAILCLSAILILPWIKKLESKQNKTLSIVFLAFTGLCSVLWIIAAIIIYVIVVSDSISASASAVYISALKWIIIISAQFLTASTITSMIMRYKKTYLIFQIITTISMVFVDLYVSCILFGLYFDAENSIQINKGIYEFIFSTPMIALFVMFIVFSAISLGIINRMERNRGVGGYVRAARQEKYQQASKEVAELPKEEAPSATERLAKLKEMLDAGLITQEEFEAKKAEILNEV